MPKKKEFTYKLGKLAPRKDDRTLLFGDYVKVEVIKAPDTYVWSGKVKDWGMMANDRLGDCTIASAGHAVQDWSANATEQYNIPDNDIIKAYSDINGYDPATGLNDNGCVEIDVLNYWRKQGIGGRKIEAYAAVNVHDKQAIMAAIYLFGGIYTGIALPISAQQQDVWDVPNIRNRNSRKGSWGGHAVFICDYDQTHLTCITWGTLKKLTWEFFFAYCDEAYAIISADFLNKEKAPNGFDHKALQEDLAKI